MALSSKTVLRADNVTLTYQDGREVIYAVRKVDLHISSGDFVAILGPSGSGKTSLLYVPSGIRSPDLGQVYLDGQAINAAGVSREAIRRHNFGFVFQQYFLINYLNVVQNVVVGAVRENAESHERARTLVKRLGLEGMERRKPYELSAGQRQWVAIARALINKPLVLLADEPTANPDHATGETVMDLLAETREDSALVVAAHDETALKRANRLYHCRWSAKVGHI